MGELFRRGTKAIGVGSVCLIISKLIEHAPAVITWREFAAFSLMSCLIGWYTLIFEVESLTYYVLFPIHLLLSFVTSSLVQSYLIADFKLSKWLSFFPGFLIIYLLVWLFIIIRRKLVVEVINQNLRR
ncbi:hypothetical protein RV04_GL001372 [Enterococcus hermanniensis]|uniref:DUF3021 domain-containing protein n=2 Tax=Enterococcus hermanniensis TaxID=249189 RepID=A0A1L8TPG4_9ENTE|nr:hypothetical protein RV04_GL001372 [Enterococcus hermanniensis]